MFHNCFIVFPCTVAHICKHNKHLLKCLGLLQDAKVGVANGTSKNVGLGKFWQDILCCVSKTLCCVSRILCCVSIIVCCVQIILCCVWKSVCCVCRYGPPYPCKQI